MHVGQARAVPLPDVAERAQRVAGVEPAGGLIDAHGVEVRHVRELVGHVAVAADDAAAVAQHADDAAVLPVPLLLLVGELELAEQVVAHRARLAGFLDLRHETRPRPFFELVEQLGLWLSVIGHHVILLVAPN